MPTVQRKYKKRFFINPKDFFFLTNKCSFNKYWFATRVKTESLVNYYMKSYHFGDHRFSVFFVFDLIELLESTVEECGR